MNRKGQVGGGIIKVVFGAIAFIILWAMFFAEIINEQCQMMIATYNLTGYEAFLLLNMNLWIGIGLFLGVLGYVYFSGGNNA